MNKTRRIAIRLTPLELESLNRIAQVEQRKPSEALREIIREAAQRRGIWPAPQKKAA
jgi:hypothetical protein